ncbi:Glycosyltransferase involved in cell wall bisynthesis [Tistlia consotensis]|uniref:Glycosyltransferase involved in cell wall bisynthesis n=1 Tax=Tistlia consotensis USBA 355 TaxID=560819 RepID=A0A1Y6BJW3_9PROT|nr:glycosyltransferase family 4 protein [Tistlia consotensis]SMF06847.1 Glycosyltransferase involved in cell wall bisynthesis [Tistlia consotensis USBA 355]SNR36269.1 Glycosyltransferase involved in cell wall bisynthesis [Tistlia consotensis]
MTDDLELAEAGGDPSIVAQADKDLPPVVLQVLPALVTGGVERGTVDMAQAILEEGAIAIVASSGGPMVYELQRSGADHVELPLDSKNPWRILSNARKLEELIRLRSVSIVHARSRAPAWSAWLATRRTGRAFVTTFHAPYGLKPPIKRLYNQVMARGDRVICISHFVAEHVQRNYRVDPARLRVIPRGVDLERFDPTRISAERVIQLAQRWRLPDGVPVIMLPGRLTRWKGAELLLAAAARLARDREFLLLLVGSDRNSSLRAELESKAAAFGLGGKFAAVGDCDDMPAAFMLADVVVSASLEPEGFGRVIGEAQAMGRPVVAAAHGGALEQVEDGETGFLFNPGDVESLAVSLRHALDLPAGARAELAERAVAHVRAHFSKRLMCRRTLEVYDELLRG